MRDIQNYLDSLIATGKVPQSLLFVESDGSHANEFARRLSSEIRERDNQVKLLTDSQHKPGWWVKFTSWFLGTR